MDHLTSNQVVVLFLSLGTLLAAARILGEVARKLKQAAVLGEIVAGVILGPTVLGAVWPEASQYLFPQSGSVSVAMNGLTSLAIALFLLVAGMEVDLSVLWRQGKLAMGVGMSSIVIPFTMGFLVAWTVPGLLGWQEGENLATFALFFATVLSISALSVIVKTLMDLDMYRTDLGMAVVGAAILNDLIGWIIFAIVLSMIGDTPGHEARMSVGQTIGLTLLFTLGMLTLGRWVIHRSLAWVQAYATWPGGVLTFAMVLALLGAAFTEWIGVHAIFGAFMVGVALGDSPHLREQTRLTLDRFISFIFAPLFFASIGLKVDFAANFEWAIVLIVTVIAVAGKVLGGGVGARWAGTTWPQAWAVGFGMNIRGGMDLILALLALQTGLIGKPLFVALVIMALSTSIFSGPMMQRFLQRKKTRRITDFLSSKTFQAKLPAHTRDEAITQLCELAAPVTGMPKEQIISTVLARERIQSTGLGHRIAVPHGRIPGLKDSILAVGFSKPGVDFDAPDGEPANLICLLLTPGDDYEIQLQLLADIARTFRTDQQVTDALKATNYTEFLAFLNSLESK